MIRFIICAEETIFTVCILHVLPGVFRIFLFLVAAALSALKLAGLLRDYDGETAKTD